MNRRNKPLGGSKTVMLALFKHFDSYMTVFIMLVK